MGIRLRFKHSWSLANVAITITVKMTGLKNDFAGGKGNNFTVTPLSTFSNEISHPADMVPSDTGTGTERFVPVPDPHKIFLESGSGFNSRSELLIMIRRKKLEDIF
jgi:hypothetical protein